MMNYFISLLRWRMCFKWQRVCNNYSSVLSCVPGPRTNWVWCGLTLHELFYLVPGAAALGCGIGVITFSDRC